MENQTKLKMKRLYSFINENCMCSAGISAYESLPENDDNQQAIDHLRKEIAWAKEIEANKNWK